mgnify:CR=1 FL=1
MSYKTVTKEVTQEEESKKKKKMNASYKVKAEDVDVKEDIDAMLQGQDLSEDKTMEEILSQNLVPQLEQSQIGSYYKLLYNSLLLDDIDEELTQNRQNFEKLVFLHKEKQKILKEMED